MQIGMKLYIFQSWVQIFWVFWVFNTQTRIEIRDGTVELFPVVVGVAVERRGVPAQDVLQLSVGQVPALGGGDDDEAVL